MKKIAGFIGGALVAGALTFGGPAAAAASEFNAGSQWRVEVPQKDGATVEKPAADAIDLTAISSYNLGW